MDLRYYSLNTLYGKIKKDIKGNYIFTSNNTEFNLKLPAHFKVREWVTLIGLPIFGIGCINEFYVHEVINSTDIPH